MSRGNGVSGGGGERWKTFAPCSSRWQVINHFNCHFRNTILSKHTQTNKTHTHTNRHWQGHSYRVRGQTTLAFWGSIVVAVVVAVWGGFKFEHVENVYGKFVASVCASVRVCVHLLMCVTHTVI